MNEILKYGENIFNDGLLIFLIKSLVIFIFFKIIVKIIEKYIKKIIPNKNKSFQTLAPFYINSLRTIAYGITFFIILSNIKPLSSLGKAVLGASSILAVIVGLAAQEALGNFISGIILSIYQPFQVGDMIIIKEKNILGTVKTIGFRHTVLRTLENTDIIVPNSLMNTSIIENRETEEKNYRNSLLIDISYESNIEKAREIIIDLALKNGKLVDNRNIKQKKNNEPLVMVYCNNFKEYSIELRTIFYTKTFLSGYEMCSELREEIKREFSKNGIIIPYPTHILKKI